MSEREQLMREAEALIEYFEAPLRNVLGIYPPTERDKKAAELIRRLLSLLPKEGEEPTEEMVEAGDLFLTNASFVSVSPAQIKAIYKAMIEARPK